MKNSLHIVRCIVLISSSFLAPSGPLFAQEPAHRPPARMARPTSGDFHWVQHTQRTLNDLKIKLNLTPDQTAAWDTWSAGVIGDARAQLDQKRAVHETSSARDTPIGDGTTPERMTRGIERMRAQVNWMQQHLVRLEAAQVRTRAFYNVLSRNQKSALLAAGGIGATADAGRGRSTIASLSPDASGDRPSLPGSS